MEKKLFLTIGIIFLVLAATLFSLKFYCAATNCVYSARQKSISTPETTGQTVAPKISPGGKAPVVPGKIEVEEVGEIEEALSETVDLEEPLDFDLSFDF